MCQGSCFLSLLLKLIRFTLVNLTDTINQCVCKIQSWPYLIRHKCAAIVFVGCWYLSEDLQFIAKSDLHWESSCKTDVDGECLLYDAQNILNPMELQWDILKQSWEPRPFFGPNLGPAPRKKVSKDGRGCNRRISSV